VARKPDVDLVPWAQANDRIVIAYSPLAQGLLGGRYDVDNPPPPGVRANNALFLPDILERAQPLLTALREIAAAHGATPAQVALAWVIRRPNVVAIPGASSVEQLEANVAAADLDLTDAEDARLTAESDAFSPTRGLAALPGLIAARRAGSSDAETELGPGSETEPGPGSGPATAPEPAPDEEQAEG
jgi:aryl-alcohol dehydrogenase-like predicted oxidoreductase